MKTTPKRTMTERGLGKVTGDTRRVATTMRESVPEEDEPADAAPVRAPSVPTRSLPRVERIERVEPDEPKSTSRARSQRLPAVAERTEPRPASRPAASRPPVSQPPAASRPAASHPPASRPVSRPAVERRPIEGRSVERQSGTPAPKPAAAREPDTGTRRRTVASRSSIAVDHVPTTAKAIDALNLAARAVPRLTKTKAEIAAAPIDHRTGFLLAHIDGTTSVQGLVDIAGMAENEVHEILDRLRRLGIVAIR